MFIQIFLSETDFIMVNSQHIVTLQPGPTGGTHIILVNGTKLYSPDSYTTILDSMTI